jgi:hypothetical protein
LAEYLSYSFPLFAVLQIKANNFCTLKAAKYLTALTENAGGLLD